MIGLIAAVRLPLEAFPEVSPPFIFVQLPYTGSTPEEVERTLLRPVEEALSTMTGIKRMDAQANAEGASIFMQFSDWSRDVDFRYHCLMQLHDALEAGVAARLAAHPEEVRIPLAQVVIEKKMPRT